MYQHVQIKICVYHTDTLYVICFLFHILQIKRRFIINLPAFRVRIVDKDGIHELPTIKPQVSVRSIPSESL